MCTPKEESVRNKLKRRGYVASKRRGATTFSLHGQNVRLEAMSVEGLEAIVQFIDARK